VARHDEFEVGAGLLEDAWFHAGIYGLHGFSKTLAGWALGGLGARFDLNHVWGRSLVGAALFLMDRLVEAGLLLFAGFHTVIAWGANGLAWETGKLTWEGLTLGAVDGNVLNGMGWDMMADKEVPFEVDLSTGKHTGGGFRG